MDDVHLTKESHKKLVELLENKTNLWIVIDRNPKEILFFCSLII